VSVSGDGEISLDRLSGDVGGMPVAPAETRTTRIADFVKPRSSHELQFAKYAT